MLRNVLDEITERRLWPIPALALLIALAAPLLFLQSSPSGTPAASAPAPAAPASGSLPARAARLLATTGADAQSGRKAPSGSASDPFTPPASSAGAKAASTKSGSSSSPSSSSGGNGSAAGATEPVPVVITNPDGTTPAGSGAASSPTPPIGAGSSTAPATVAKAARPKVDVRYGERLPGRLHRGIPRLQTFVAGGRAIAIFVKYSPKRDKAVFAIAPRTLVTGDVECRRKQGLCRYVDIPVGKHARLTTFATDGSLVTRRLDVVRITRSRRSGTTAAAASRAPADGRCLLDKLLALGAHDWPLARSACGS